MNIDPKDIHKYNKNVQKQINDKDDEKRIDQLRSNLGLEVLDRTKPKRNKYNVARFEDRTMDGIVFDSKSEMKRYEQLKYMQMAGLIKDLRLQEPFVLIDAGVNNFGQKWQPTFYFADFVYTEGNNSYQTVEEHKGFKTKDYMIKRKLFMSRYPQIKFFENNYSKKRKK